MRNKKIVKEREYGQREEGVNRCREKTEKKMFTNVNNAMGFRDKFNKFDRVCVYVRWS